MVAPPPGPLRAAGTWRRRWEERRLREEPGRRQWARRREGGGGGNSRGAAPGGSPPLRPTPRPLPRRRRLPVWVPIPDPRFLDTRVRHGCLSAPIAPGPLPRGLEGAEAAVWDEEGVPGLRSPLHPPRPPVGLGVRSSERPGALRIQRRRAAGRPPRPLGRSQRRVSRGAGRGQSLQKK